MRMFIFMLFMFPLLGYPQEIPLFKIVSQHGSVLLDGDSTHCGQAVTSKNQKLEIQGSGSYAIILTEAGYAFKLKRGVNTTEGVFKIKKSNLAEIRKEMARGAVNREQVEDIWVMSMGYEYADAFHDSLTIIWKAQQPVGTEYTVRIVSMLDDLLYDSIVNFNALTVNLSEMFKTEEGVIFNIRARKSSSGHHLIKKIKEEDKRNVSHDLSCIPEGEFIERTLLTLAVCEVHNLYYDQIHYLYKLWRHEQESGMKINHPYYQRLLQAHGFEYFFKPVSNSN